MYKNSALSLNARSVCNHLFSNYALPSQGYFNSGWVDEAFVMYNINMNYSGSGAAFGTVKNIISQGKPIYAGISNSNISHAVVICGYRQDVEGNCFYTLMDPNEETYVTIEIVNPNSINFVYASSSGRYTTWHRRYW